MKYWPTLAFHEPVQIKLLYQYLTAQIGDFMHFFCAYHASKNVSVTRGRRQVAGSVS